MLAAEAAPRTWPASRAVVVKRGAAGASWLGPDGATVRGRRRCRSTVVDPTGAGDAFAAGLLAAWLAGADAGGRAARGRRGWARWRWRRVGARPRALTRRRRRLRLGVDGARGRRLGRQRRAGGGSTARRRLPVEPVGEPVLVLDRAGRWR